jgi:cell division protein FtsB
MKRPLILIPFVLVLCLPTGCARQKRSEAAVLQLQRKVDSLAKKNKSFSERHKRLRQTNSYQRVEIKRLNSVVKSTSRFKEAIVDVHERDQAIERGKQHIRQLNHQLKKKESEYDRMKRQMEASDRRAAQLREELAKLKGGRRN